MDLGLHRAGLECIGQCEVDPWRRGILARHWPEVPRWDDVATLDPAQVAGPVDLIAGGFPCQDVSVAGRRAGLAGARTGLFWEAMRLVDAIRPRFVLLENVVGLLSSNRGRDFGVVVGALADIGYGVGWRVLDSQHFGVPQRRRRVFILGVLGAGRAGAERAGAVLAVGTRCPGHPATGTAAGPSAALRPAPRTRVDGSPHGVNEAVTKKWVKGSAGPSGDECQNLVMMDRYYVEDHANGTLRANGAHGGPPRTDRQPLAVGADHIRRFTPVETGRLQGFPDDWFGEGPPDGPRLAAIGDAVTVPVAQWLGQRLVAA